MMESVPLNLATLTYFKATYFFYPRSHSTDFICKVYKVITHFTKLFIKYFIDLFKRRCLCYQFQSKELTCMHAMKQN